MPNFSQEVYFIRVIANRRVEVKLYTLFTQIKHSSGRRGKVREGEDRGGGRRGEVGWWRGERRRSSSA